jgi:hypothetical protein
VSSFSKKQAVGTASIFLVFVNRSIILSASFELLMSIRFSTAFESYGFFIPPAVAAVAAFLVMGEPFEFKLGIYCSHTGFIHYLCRIEVERSWKAKEREKE